MPDFYTPFSPNQTYLTMASQQAPQYQELSNINQMNQMMAMRQPYVDLGPQMAQASLQQSQLGNQAAQQQVDINQPNVGLAPQLAQSRLTGTPFQQNQLYWQQQMAMANMNRNNMLAESLIGRRSVQNDVATGGGNKPVFGNGPNGPGFYWPQGTPKAGQQASQDEVVQSDAYNGSQGSGQGAPGGQGFPGGQGAPGGQGFPPQQSQWLGPQPTGNFQGNPAQIQQGFNQGQWVNPGEKAAAQQALYNQMSAQGVPTQQAPGMALTPNQKMDAYGAFTKQAGTSVLPLDQMQQKINLIRNLVQTNSPESWIQAERLRGELVNTAQAQGANFQQKELDNIGTFSGRIAGSISQFIQGTGTEQQRNLVMNSLNSLQNNVIQPTRTRIIQGVKDIATRRGLDPSQIVVPNPYSQGGSVSGGTSGKFLGFENAGG